MTPKCTLTPRGSQPTCKGAIHPLPPCHPLNPLRASKASATRDTRTCAHIVHAHTHTHTHIGTCLRSTFHNLSSFSAATPTSSHLFPLRSFQQPVPCLPAVTRPAFVEECDGHFEAPTTRSNDATTNLWKGDLSAVDPAPHYSPPNPTFWRASSTVRGSHWLHRKNFPQRCEYNRELLYPQQNTQTQRGGRHRRQRQTDFLLYSKRQTRKLMINHRKSWIYKLSSTWKGWKKRLRRIIL